MDAFEKNEAGRGGVKKAMIGQFKHEGLHNSDCNRG